ncbi:MAG: ABC transporter permease [Corynebacteriales bacterium]|nr:ABC transporter permease [Mycobacteriales bacterium]
MREALELATWETLYMVGWSALWTVVLGLPLGVLLVVTSRGHLATVPALNAVLGAIVNIGRSLPFIILLVAVVPLTRTLAGTSIGPNAAIVPLTIAAVPFFARIVETSLREVDAGLLETGQALGASRLQIIRKILLPEALPGLVAGITITVVALISYSAMAGVVGAGGLGDLAVRRGYQGYETDITVACVIALVALVQALQSLGDFLARRLTH